MPRSARAAIRKVDPDLLCPSHGGERTGHVRPLGKAVSGDPARVIGTLTGGVQACLCNADKKSHNPLV